MKATRIETIKSRLPALVVFLALVSIYLSTIAPGLTWANGGSDGGDLVTAAATGGVAHPTGYPLYLLLARLFQFLPVGSLAFRTNLMSALVMALTAALVCDLVMQSISSQRITSPWSGGLAAGFTFGLAPVVWSQAVITEVHALQAFLVVLIFHFYALQEMTPGPVRPDFKRGLVLGLAMGNHITSLLLLPMALMLGSAKFRQTGGVRFEPSALRRQLGGLAIGLSFYLILPLRAMANPPVNWGNVISPERFWWLISGQLYQGYYLRSSLPELGERIQSLALLLLQQFNLAGVVLALVGLVIYGNRSRLYILTAWTAFGYSAFSISYRSVDSYLYLIPAFLCLAIWLGLGLARLGNSLELRSKWVGHAIFLLLLVSLGARSATLLGDVDASRDMQAETFGKEILSAAPQDAILFAKGDRAVFALWYFHFALGQRPDLAILAEDLLHFDWYQENLRSLYPSLRIPGPLPWPETIAIVNPERRVCSVRYTTGAELICRQ